MQALSICTRVCDGCLGWQLWQLMLDRSFLLTYVLMTYHAVRMKWRHQVISLLETKIWAPEYFDIRDLVFQSKKLYIETGLYLSLFGPIVLMFWVLLIPFACKSVLLMNCSYTKVGIEREGPAHVAQRLSINLWTGTSRFDS